MTEKIMTTEFKKHEKDTGSSGFQIAELSSEIKRLTGHLGINKKDYACRRSLLLKVARRKSLLKYLKRTDEKMYVKVIEAFKLKR